jgi:hypothetical protein
LNPIGQGFTKRQEMDVDPDRPLLSLAVNSDACNDILSFLCNEIMAQKREIEGMKERVTIIDTRTEIQAVLDRLNEFMRSTTESLEGMNRQVVEMGSRISSLEENFDTKLEDITREYTKALEDKNDDFIRELNQAKQEGQASGKVLLDEVSSLRSSVVGFRDEIAHRSSCDDPLDDIRSQLASLAEKVSELEEKGSISVQDRSFLSTLRRELDPAGEENGKPGDSAAQFFTHLTDLKDQMDLLKQNLPSIKSVAEKFADPTYTEQLESDGSMKEQIGNLQGQIDSLRRALSAVGIVSDDGKGENATGTANSGDSAKEREKRKNGWIARPIADDQNMHGRVLDMVEQLSARIKDLSERMDDYATKDGVFHAIRELTGDDGGEKLDETAVGRIKCKCLACGRPKLNLCLKTDTTLLDLLGYPPLPKTAREPRSISKLQRFDWEEHGRKTGGVRSKNPSGAVTPRTKRGDRVAARI